MNTMLSDFLGHHWVSPGVIFGNAKNDGFKGTESNKLYLSAVRLTEPSDISDNTGRKPGPITCMQYFGECAVSPQNLRRRRHCDLAAHRVLVPPASTRPRLTPVLNSANHSTFAASRFNQAPQLFWRARRPPASRTDPIQLLRAPPC